MVERTEITVAALAREAGVGYRTTREWLLEERKTQPAKEAALKAAYARLGGNVARQEGSPALPFDVVIKSSRSRAKP